METKGQNIDIKVIRNKIDRTLDDIKKDLNLYGKSKLGLYGFKSMIKENRNEQD